jgi:hypothetical protein
MIAVATTHKGLFGIPQGTYSVGDTIAGGGVVIYKGPALSTSYSISDTTNLFIGFKAWSVSDENYYSKGIFDFGNYTPCPTFAGNKYVKQGGTGTGASWIDASGDLQAMINQCVAGDSIFVAAGTYKPNRPQYNVYHISPNNRSNSFVLKAGITLLGGFPSDVDDAGVEDRDYNAYPTILSGDIGTIGSTTDNCYNVVYCDEIVDHTTLIDGFMITGGNASIATNNSGGGWRNFGHCRANNIHFFANNAVYGGGMLNAGNTTLNNVVFTNNYASNLGGGLYTYGDSMTVVRAVFDNNEAPYGAGLFVGGGLHLDSAIIEGNSSSMSGAGAYLIEGGIHISSTIFKNNDANNGGAIYNDGTHPSLTNVTFDANTAESAGGTWYNFDGDPQLINNLIVNGGSYYGGAWYNRMGNPNFKNVTISNNNTESGSSGNVDRMGGTPMFTNCIIWGNTASYPIYSNTAYIDNTSLIHTINGEDLVFNSDSVLSIGSATVLNLDDFSLTPCSPAINTGLNDSVATTTDLLGNMRIINNQVDLGAMEKSNLELNETANSVLIADEDCSSGDWIHYLSSATNKIILSLNTNGQDLGVITAKGILNDQYGTGTIHTLDDAFESGNYLYPFNRSWAITSAVAPTEPVNIRFYFSDTDSTDIATNIPLSRIADLILYKVDGEDAWNSSATGYTSFSHGDAATLTNYQLGYYQGLLYAEFQVNGFSTGSMAFASPTPLPVVILSFSGRNINNEKTQLQWSITQAEALQKFEIEKSKDGATWEHISSVLPSLEGQYQEYDLTPYPSTNLYRLKIIDNNGSFKYSDIVQVNFDTSNQYRVNVHPNPNNGKFTIDLSNNPFQSASLILTDVTGRMIFREVVTTKQTEIEIQSIQTGVYTLQVKIDNNTSYHKLVIY